VLEDVYIPETPDIKMTKINQKGEALFSFTKRMIVPSDLSVFNDDILLISLTPGADSDKANLGFSW